MTPVKIFLICNIKSFSEFNTKFKFTTNSLQNVLDVHLFCNENIKFRDKSVLFIRFYYIDCEL